MVLALALSLAGYEEDDFRGIIAMFSSSTERRGLQCDNARTKSPSTRSESSGISSLILSSISLSYSGPSSISSISSSSSRSETPENENPRIVTKSNTPLRILQNKRDILNLAYNLSDPSWNIKSPTMPRNDTKSFIANRSIYHRLGKNALEEDYPKRVCLHCGFTEPSPYLFE